MYIYIYLEVLEQKHMALVASAKQAQLKIAMIDDAIWCYMLAIAARASPQWHVPYILVNSWCVFGDGC